MSNVMVIPEAENVPAHIRNPDAAKVANADAGCGISTGVPPRVKISAKTFKLVDGNGEEKPYPPAKMVADDEGNTYLPVIVLRAKRELRKTWYTGAYNPDEDAKAPDCFSEDTLKPHPEVNTPQSESCETCPLNAFGSGTDQNGNSTKGKACSDTKILAVFVPDFGVHSLKIPAASLKNFGLFVKNLSVKGIPVGSIKTLVGFDLTCDFPKLIFGFGGYLPEKVMPAIDKVRASEEVNDIIGGTSATALAVQPSDKAEADAKAKAEADAKAKAEADATAITDDLGLGDLGLVGDMEVMTSEPVTSEPVTLPAETTTSSAADVSNEELAAELGL